MIAFAFSFAFACAFEFASSVDLPRFGRSNLCAAENGPEMNVVRGVAGVSRCMHLGCMLNTWSALASADAPCKGSEFRSFAIFCCAQIVLSAAKEPARQV